MPMRRIRTVWSGVAGTPWYSNHYFAFSPGTVQLTLDAVEDFWIAVNGAICNEVFWQIESDVAVVDEATGDITSIETGTGGGGQGANTNDPLPWATQGLINWLTGQFSNGRQVRGKTYVPGLCEDGNTTGGVMSSGLQTTIQGAADGLIADADSGGFNLQVYTRVNTGDVEVASASVPTKWAVLRSRRD